MSESFRYRAFLSYSHRDQKWADWLHRSLESYRVPPRLADLAGRKLPRRIAPVFRDRDELPSAPSLSAEVTRALEMSESLIVICSPNAVASRWVNEEIATFKRLGRAARIFCLIVDGAPNSGGNDECFPPALRGDGSGRADQTARAVEPVAADARPQGDGRTNAKLKLIAGILDIGFDALRQRDLHRRHRRLAAITAASVAIALLTGALAVFAILARAESEQRRAQAEDLIGFMVGDLRTRLHEIGRLDIFMSVGNKVMDYFAEFSDEDVSSSMLDERALALRQIGEIRLDQGEPDAAMEAFRESAAISSRLVAREPDNAEWQIALANSYFYLGYVSWQRGELGQARREFEAVLPIVDAVVENHPDEPKWLAEQGYAYTNLGRILELEGDFERALEIYRRVMSINLQLRELQPDNTDWQLEVGFSHNNLGKLEASLGRLGRAEEHYRKDLKIKAEVSDAHPQHNLWRYYLSVSHAHLARIKADRGDFGQSRAHFLAALDIMEDLVRLDPTQLTWKRQQMNLERELAAVTARTGQLAEAEVRLSVALAGLADLVATDSTNAIWAQDLALARIEAAQQALRQDELAGARSQIDAARRTITGLLQDSGNRALNRHLVAVELISGDIAAARGDIDAATASWRSAMATVESAFSGTSDPAILDLRAGLLQRLGDAATADTLVARLESMDYHCRFTDLDRASHP